MCHCGLITVTYFSPLCLSPILIIIIIIIVYNLFLILYV